MADIDMTSDEILEIFGGEVQPIESDAQELEVGLALHSIRNQLATTAAHANIGTVQLAKRAGVAPSAVSRFLSSEGDMKVSTAILYARALGHRWDFALSPDISCSELRNNDAQIRSVNTLATSGTTSRNHQLMTFYGPPPISPAPAVINVIGCT